MNWWNAAIAFLKRDGEEEELWKLTAETASKSSKWIRTLNWVDPLLA
jgi:hypothetical protein